jgi:hypothetical protein
VLTSRHLVKAAGAGLALSGSGFAVKSIETTTAPTRINLPAALPQDLAWNYGR